jgi:hypothetical protein
LPSINLQKWTATVILIIGSAVNGLGYYPAGPALLAVGGLIWLAVAVQIQDRALITTNAVMSAVTLAAILIHFL